MERMTGFEPAIHGLGSRCPTARPHPLVMYSMDFHYPYYTHTEASVQVRKERGTASTTPASRLAFRGQLLFIRFQF